MEDNNSARLVHVHEVDVHSILYKICLTVLDK